jgi:hypothetical protein
VFSVLAVPLFSSQIILAVVISAIAPAFCFPANGVGAILTPIALC